MPSLRTKRPSLTLRPLQTSLAWESLRACRPSGANRAQRSLRSGLTSEPRRSLQTCLSLRPLWSLRSYRPLGAGITLLTRLADGALWTDWSLRSFRSLRASIALLTNLTNGPLGSDRSLRPCLSTRSARVSGNTLRPLGPFGSNRAGGPGNTLRSDGTFGSLRSTRIALRPRSATGASYALRTTVPGIAFRPLRSLRSPITLRSFGTLRTLWSSGPRFTGRALSPFGALRAGRALVALLTLQTHFSCTRCY